MKANEYQKHLHTLLKQHFSEDDVKSEWSIWKDATDGWQDRKTYAPRLDIAVGPFNIDRDRERGTQNIIACRDDPVIKNIIDKARAENPDFVVNPNPRCLLAIEIEFSGSSKHILGDYTNASMMGLIGIVISSDANHKRIVRIGEYAKTLRTLEKAPNHLFSNTVCFENDEFINLVRRL